MEASGVDAFEIYVDEAKEMLYLNNTEAWFKEDISEVENMNPYLSYSNGIDEETLGHLEAIQNSIKDFKEATINMDENTDYWYSFTVDSITDVEVVFDQTNNAPDVEIYDNGFYYYNSSIDYSTYDRYYRLWPGTYYLHLYDGEGSNTFHLNLFE